jgi:hypothetical protein
MNLINSEEISEFDTPGISSLYMQRGEQDLQLERMRQKQSTLDAHTSNVPKFAQKVSITKR